MTTYRASFLFCANRMLDSESGFKIIDVLLIYSTGTAGTVINFFCKSLSWVAIMYLGKPQT